MRYAQIREMDISNGEGIGVSHFVQGSKFHCKGCFNSETWDFNGGKEWTDEVRDNFIELVNKPYIKRVSILGGEPLDPKNIKDVSKLISKIRKKYKERKIIWLYTGFDIEKLVHICTEQKENEINIDYCKCLEFILENIDVIIDGQYIEEQKNMNLKWKGSSNQRTIYVLNDWKIVNRPELSKNLDTESLKHIVYDISNRIGDYFLFKDLSDSYYQSYKLIKDDAFNNVEKNQYLIVKEAIFYNKEK